MFVRCQMSDVCHVSLTLSCISSVIKYQKWIHLFLPQPNGFCQVRLLSINCANMQNCFCNVDSTDLPKPSSANLPHLLSIYAEMVPPVYLSKMEKMFFLCQSQSISSEWKCIITFSFDQFLTTWTTTSKAQTERHSGRSERSWLQAIPHICHESHENSRVNFFWPV